MVDARTAGFTGTQRGMTEAQRLSVLRLLGDLKVTTVRHGMCEGADQEFHQIARNLNLRVFGHPGVTWDGRVWKRAIVICDHEAPPAPFLVRNRDIIGFSGVMIATPGETFEVVRSGTWATIRHTGKPTVLKPLYIVWPNGGQEFFEHGWKR